MKLRNKKTGEVMGMSMAGDIVWVGNYRYKSIAELNEDWEDYEPAEPLIKDERIREAVRAWYNILPRLEDKRIFYENGVLWVGVYEFDCGQYDLLNVRLKSGEYYIIEELCGEVEAPEPLEPTFVDLDERIREKEE